MLRHKLFSNRFTPCNLEPMARTSAPMTEWACDIAKAISRVLDSRKISDRELARLIGRSQNYVSIRLRCEAPLSLADLDAISTALELDPASLLHGVPRNRVSAPAHTVANGADVAEVHGRDKGTRSAYGLAAKRGTRAADREPHAE